jgi:hypothetical protein
MQEATSSTVDNLMSLREQRRLVDIGSEVLRRAPGSEDQQLKDSAKDKRLRVFLCHASEDKDQARLLYRVLTELGFKPWLDEEDLLPRR